MPRVQIYVPDALRASMVRFGASINWSAVFQKAACEAMEKAIEEEEKILKQAEAIKKRRNGEENQIKEEANDGS